MWKKYKDYNIEINEKGQIRNSKTKKLRKATVSKRGYLVFTTNLNGKQKLLYVHRLVAELFIKNPSNHNCINHIDGNKQNPRKENLEWCTHKENILKALYEQNLFPKYVCKCCGKEFFKRSVAINNVCGKCRNKEKRQKNTIIVFYNKLTERKSIINNVKNYNNHKRNELYSYYIIHREVLEMWSKGYTYLKIADTQSCTKQNISRIILKFKSLYSSLS